MSGAFIIMPLIGELAGKLSRRDREACFKRWIAFAENDEPDIIGE